MELSIYRLDISHTFFLVFSDFLFSGPQFKWIAAFQIPRRLSVDRSSKVLARARIQYVEPGMYLIDLIPAAQLSVPETAISKMTGFTPVTCRCIEHVEFAPLH
jgi:hypothetical protein